MDQRNINNLQGLLRFSVENTRSEDAPNTQLFEQMTPEKKQFLENVLKSMDTTVIEDYHKAIECLQSKETSKNEKLGALDEIRQFIDHIDFAMTFVKIGGSKILILCLNSEFAEMRKSCAHLVAELTQNNPFCQEHITEHEKDVLPKLMELLNDKEEEVVHSSLYAISCLVRNHEKSVAAFIKLEGIKCVLNCITQNNPRLLVKACFLLNALSTEYEIVRDEFVKHGAFEKLTQLVEPTDSYDTKLETVLDTLCTLYTSKGSNKPVITLELKQKLSEVLERCLEKPDCQEIVEYAQTLLDHFAKDQPGD